MATPTPQSPQLYLNDIDQSKHQANAAGNRTGSGDQVPDSERSLVDVGEVEGEGENGVVMGAGGEAEGLLQAQSDEAGEEETREGVDVEGD